MMRRNLWIWAAPAEDDDARCAGNSSAGFSSRCCRPVSTAFGMTASGDDLEPLLEQIGLTAAP